MKYSQYDYAVIGGDMRQVYLAEHLSYPPNRIIYYALEKTPNRCTKATSLENAIRSSDCVIGPIPLSQNGSFLKQTASDNDFTLDFLLNIMKPGQTFFAGCIPEAFLTGAKEKGIYVHDLMQNNTLAIYNTLATAEGAICEAIQKSPQNLHHSKCAVLGFGRCGRTLTNYLKGLSCHVYAYSIEQDERSWAETVADHAGSLQDFESIANEFDFVFNTIPALVLTEKQLRRLKASVTIIDIASVPGGVDYEATTRLGINAFHCLALPGKYSPESCAIAIKNIISTYKF